MKALRYIFMLGYILMNSMIPSSCDVHEFPDPEIPFVLNLNFDTSLPLYKVITHTNESRANTENDNFDIRYIVEAYLATEENKNNNRTALYRFQFIKDDISTHNYRVELPLKKGVYNFVVWSDYVTKDSSDLFYNTSTFEEITLCGNKHEGSNDFRDAFRGTITSEVSDIINSATVEMQRPMAKFNFISNDVSEFVSKIHSIRAKKEDSHLNNNENLEFSDFNIVFRYTGFMPNSFNAYSNKPIDATVGVSFNSKIKILENGDAELGFDYIFVNGAESSISVSVEVYDYDGELLSQFEPIEVPLVRSHLTTIKANFLTVGTGGVSILPDYDGDLNIQVQ